MANQLELSLAEELEGIVEKLVTSGEMNVDKPLLKKLKSHCKKSNLSLEYVFHLLCNHLERDHSEVRYSTFQVIQELFVRSHIFRNMLLEQFQNFMELAVGIDFDNPLPPPKATADKLRFSTLSAIQDWYNKYGVAYPKLVRAYDFLKQVKNIKFDQLESINQSPAQEQRLSRQQIVNAMKMDKLKKELDASLWEIKDCNKEINGCLKLIVPSFTEDENASDQVEKDVLSTNELACGSKDAPPEENSLREVGLPEKGYSLQLDLSEISTVNVSQNIDNKAVLDRVKDCVTSANRIYLPRLREWLTVAGKCGDSSNLDLVKELIDVKDEIQGALSKYYQLNHVSESDEESCDDFIEVPEAVEFDLKPKQTKGLSKRFMHTHNSANKTIKDKEVKKKMSSTNTWKPLRKDDNLNDPTSYQLALALQAELLKNRKEGDDSTKQSKLKKVFPPKKLKPFNMQSESNLLREKAPVVPFGQDLLEWDKEKIKELRENLFLGATKELDIGHKFWSGGSASASDSGVSDAALSALTSRTIEFTGEFVPVVKHCRAPLPNGKLCPRQDRYKCPFHGKIINRDECGNPTSSSDQPSTSSVACDNGWQDAEFLRDVEANVGGSLNLTVKKHGKRKLKKQEHGLTDLKNMNNTSRSRLQRKVLNPGSLKRVSETLNHLDTKRNLDKFGNNFNYALN